MKLVSFATVALAILSFSANATIINIINGNKLEWLELTATQHLNRNEVETLLTNESSVLYGYQYAPRKQVENLFQYYMPWDGISGFHGNSTIVANNKDFLNLFGITSSFAGNGLRINTTTTDGYTVQQDGYIRNDGLYGATGECSTNPLYSCLAWTQIGLNAEGAPITAAQYGQYGFDSTISFPALTSKSYSSGVAGSYLVKKYVSVPEPSILWLLSIGMLVIFKFTRRFG